MGLHNYTRYGFAVCFVYLAITALLTILNTSGWTKQLLNAFWWTMIFAGISSFFLIEPLCMGAIWLYRWLLRRGRRRDDGHASVRRRGALPRRRLGVNTPSPTFCACPSRECACVIAHT